MSVLTRIQSNHEPYQFANAISLWLHTMLNMEEDPGLHARDYRYETVATPCTCRLQVHFPVCLLQLPHACGLLVLPLLGCLLDDY